MARLTWDKTDIVQALKKLHKEGKDLSYTQLAKKNQPLVSAAAYHFGSYRTAVEKAGIPYTEIVRRPRWTKQEIIRLIKQGKRDSQDLHWSAVTKRGDELGRAAFASLQDRLFGSWDRALSAAGLDADEISQYRKWGRDTIASELKARNKEGEALNSGAVQKEDPGLHAAAVRHFGSYDNALRAAKVDPAKIRRRQRWSEEEVVKQLKAFGKKHGISDAALREHQPALYGAALRFFGSIASARTAAT
ncbi:MAG: hypothetical protein ACAI43_16595 [Phycisphaerae bacterium]|nr:hypothetical protein [Tepidisphaeraceae bacterium]